MVRKATKNAYDLQNGNGKWIAFKELFSNSFSYSKYHKLPSPIRTVPTNTDLWITCSASRVTAGQ